MGKVVYIDKEMRELFEKVGKLQGGKVHSICVVATREDENGTMEEFYFCGSPATILQSLALAQGFILQSYPLMDECDVEVE